MQSQLKNYFKVKLAAALILFLAAFSTSAFAYSTPQKVSYIKTTAKSGNQAVIKNYNDFYNNLNQIVASGKSSASLTFQKYSLLTYDFGKTLSKIYTDNKALKSILTSYNVSFTSNGKTTTALINLNYENSDTAAGNFDDFTKAVASAIKDKKATISIKVPNYTAANYSLSKAIEALWNSSSPLNCTAGISSVVSDKYGSAILKLSFDYVDKAIEDDSTTRILNSADINNLIFTNIGQYNSDINFTVIDPAYSDPQVVLQQIKDMLDKYNETSYIDSVDITNYRISITEDVIVNKYNLHVNYRFSKDQITQMNAAVSAKVQEIISSIITPGMTEYQKEVTIHDYIAKNTSYNYNSFISKQENPEDHTAYGVLIKHVGVCDGYATAFKKLLDAAGVENIIVVGTAEGQNHAWNIVKLDGQYYQVDVTFDSPFVRGTSRQIMTHNYFNVTDSVMAQDHVWDRSKYPACTSINYSH